MSIGIPSSNQTPTQTPELVALWGWGGQDIKSIIGRFFIGDPPNRILEVRDIDFSQGRNAKLLDALLKYNNPDNNHPESFLRFNNCNMSGVNLSGRNLSNIEFYESNLSGANLQNTRIVGPEEPSREDDKLIRTSRFHYGTNFTGADFSGATIRYIKFHDCNFHSADFRGATIESSRFDYVQNINTIRINNSTDFRKSEITYNDDFPQQRAKELESFFRKYIENGSLKVGSTPSGRDD